jgi:hemoglobin
MGSTSSSIGSTSTWRRSPRRERFARCTLPISTEVRDKLAVFLVAWLGGPNEYRSRFGAISIPGFHARFAIDEAERDAWLLCMARAVDEQPWAEAFKFYFMQAIAVPAERVRVASVMRRTDA